MGLALRLGVRVRVRGGVGLGLGLGLGVGSWFLVLAGRASLGREPLEADSRAREPRDDQEIVGDDNPHVKHTWQVETSKVKVKRIGKRHYLLLTTSPLTTYYLPPMTFHGLLTEGGVLSTYCFPRSNTTYRRRCTFHVLVLLYYFPCPSTAHRRR